MAKRKLKAIDLFCGCGGLTLGLKQAGFEVIGAVDIDHLAVETYKVNHPEVEVWHQDICNLSTLCVKRKLHLRKGKLDLLAGCPPCQGFSTVRTLNGAKKIYDERNDLVFEFLRFVKELMPKAIMMENVPGLSKDRRFICFCKKLNELGYTVNYDILDASEYAVPQRRKRLILLASRNGKIGFAKKARCQRTVFDAIGDLPLAGTSGDELHDLPESRTEKIKKLIRMIPKNGGSRNDLGKRRQLACHKKCDGFKDVYGRMAWDKVGPTITSGCTNPSKGRFLHPEKDRAITLREAALLQTFPSNYYFSLDRGKGATAIMIGNALPPEFIKRHGDVVKKCVLG